jgi:hypothetical protein
MNRIYRLVIRESRMRFATEEEDPEEIEGVSDLDSERGQLR